MAERELNAGDWRGYGRQEFPQAAWSVDGNVLHAVAGGEKIDLISRERFTDFALLFDWRVPRAGNTQVLTRVDEAAGPAPHTGAALQLLDDEHHPEGTDALTSCGALYGVMAPWRDHRRAANTFHAARIVMSGSRIEYWIDDHQVIGCDLASEDLKERIARSRFRDYPQFARVPEGHIVLRHCGTEVWFRRLRVDVG